MIRIFILFLLLSLIQNTFAGTNDALCSNRDNSVDAMVCGLSDKLKIPPVKVGIAFVLASLEMTGTYCDFNFSEQFLDFRINQENDMEIRKVVESLIGFYNNKPPPGFNGDKKVFCKLQYSTYSKMFK